MSEERLSRIEENLDSIKESIRSIDVTLAAQRITLREYVKRNHTLEQRFARIDRHVTTVQAVTKFIVRGIGVLSLLATIAAGLVALLKGIV